MRQTKKLMNLHSSALLEFDRIQGSVRHEREQCKEDRRFATIVGAQWEGGLEKQFANKPRFEINKIQLSLIRLYNEYRNNRITVDFVSKNGVKDDALASTCDDMYRATEQDSSALEAYDNAFDEAASGGMGAWRLTTEYEDEYDEDNDYQRILIEPIYDADTSVFFDLDAKKQDKSDAKYCFVISSYTRSQIEDDWGEDVTTWPKEVTVTNNFDWCPEGEDVVYVAEYYRVEEYKESIYTYKNIDGEEEKYTDEDFESDETLEARLSSIGTTYESERKVRRRKVRKYILSGAKVLEDCGYIAGTEIPIIPMYGKRWFIDNVERTMGLVRLAKDAQRLFNMQMSKLAEISALSTVEKPYFMPEQIAGHESMHSKDNIDDWPYLLVNAIEDANGQKVPAGPVGYTKSPNVPPALASLIQATDMSIKEVLGKQEAGEEITPNVSGKAIELIQSRLDMQTFIYMDNMSKAVKRSGEVWLSIAKDIYIEKGRVVKGISKSDEVGSIEIFKPIMDEETKEVVYQNDLRKANFDVYVDVGPTSTSKRSATVKSVTGMLQLAQDPETIQVLTATALMNMEGEGISDVKDYFRKKLVRMGVVKPNDEELAAMRAEAEAMGPSPQDQYLQAAAQEAEAKAAKARADTVYTISRSENEQADTEKKKAETIETLSSIESESERRAIEAAKALENFPD